MGHETTSWQVYFRGGVGRFLRGLDLGLSFRLRLSGALRTGGVSLGRVGVGGGLSPGCGPSGKVFRIGGGESGLCGQGIEGSEGDTVKPKTLQA